MHDNLIVVTPESLDLDESNTDHLLQGLNLIYKYLFYAYNVPLYELINRLDRIAYETRESSTLSLTEKIQKLYPISAENHRINMARTLNSDHENTQKKWQDLKASQYYMPDKFYEFTSEQLASAIKLENTKEGLSVDSILSQLACTFKTVRVAQTLIEQARQDVAAIQREFVTAMLNRLKTADEAFNLLYDDVAGCAFHRFQEKRGITLTVGQRKIPIYEYWSTGNHVDEFHSTQFGLNKERIVSFIQFITTYGTSTQKEEFKQLKIFQPSSQSSPQWGLGVPLLRISETGLFAPAGVAAHSQLKNELKNESFRLFVQETMATLITYNHAIANYEKVSAGNKPGLAFASLQQAKNALDHLVGQLNIKKVDAAYREILIVRQYALNQLISTIKQQLVAQIDGFVKGDIKTKNFIASFFSDNQTDLSDTIEMPKFRKRFHDACQDLETDHIRRFIEAIQTGKSSEMISCCRQLVAWSLDKTEKVNAVIFIDNLINGIIPNIDYSNRDVIQSFIKQVRFADQSIEETNVVILLKTIAENYVKKLPAEQKDDVVISYLQAFGVESEAMIEGLKKEADESVKILNNFLEEIHKGKGSAVIDVKSLAMKLYLIREKRETFDNNLTQYINALDINLTIQKERDKLSRFDEFLLGMRRCAPRSLAAYKLKLALHFLQEDQSWAYCLLRQADDFTKTQYTLLTIPTMGVNTAYTDQQIEALTTIISDAILKNPYTLELLNIIINHHLFGKKATEAIQRKMQEVRPAIEMPIVIAAGDIHRDECQRKTGPLDSSTSSHIASTSSPLPNLFSRIFRRTEQSQETGAKSLAYHHPRKG